VVRPGDDIEIVLEENPTTGYRWVDAMAPGILALQQSKFAPDGGGAIGAGGIRLLSFRAERAGTTDLRLELRRPWRRASPDPDAATFLVTVECR